MFYRLFALSKVKRLLTVFLWMHHTNSIWNNQSLSIWLTALLQMKTRLIVVEEDLHTDFSYVEDLGYHLVRSKEYKTNKHVFLKK